MPLSQRDDSPDGTLPVPLPLPSLDTEGQHRRHLLAVPTLASPDRPMSLRDVLARLLGGELTDTLMPDPALAAAERVLAAAVAWEEYEGMDRGRLLRLDHALTEAVDDFRAYRSAVEEK